MRIFKNKYFRRSLVVLLLLSFLILLDTWVGEMLSPVTHAAWFNHDVQQIEGSGQDADLVFLGSSRTYFTFAPQVFREKLGMNIVLNAGSSSQPPSAAYYELKDLIERIHPHHVVIGVTWNEPAEGRLQGKLIVYDRLSMKNKLLMATNCFDVSEMPYLSGTYRFKDNFNLNNIRSYAADKQELIATNYGTTHSEKRIHDNGFVYRYTSIPTGNVPIKYDGDFSEEEIKDCLRYLDACIDLCKENNVKVTLVTGVTTVMRMYVTGGYQDAVDFYTEYAKSKGVSYYNLNYLKNREEFLPDELMYDFNHVNANGAYLVSEYFAEILEKETKEEDVSSYFYPNLEEFKKDVHRIVALKANITKDSENENLYHIIIESVQNEGIKTVYRALIRRQSGDEYEVIRDWASKAKMDLRVDNAAGCTLRIEAGSTDGTYGTAFQEYDL